MEKLHKVKASGTPFEVGCRVGEKTAAGIEYVFKAYRHDCLRPSPARQARARRFLRCLERRFPRLLEEMCGMARGANLPFETVFAVNCIELSKRPLKGCTSLAWADGGRVVFGHNEDNRTDRNFMYLLSAEYDNGLCLLGLGGWGFLPGFSVMLTGRGLLQSMNYLPMASACPGLPTYCSMRATLEEETLSGVKEHFRRHKVAGGGNFFFTNGQDLLDVEARLGRHRAVEGLPSFYHTNHFLHPGMRRFNRGHALENSVSRAAQCRAFLSAHPKADEKALQGFLFSKSQSGWNILREKEAGERGEFKTTFASVLYDSARPGLLKVAFGMPPRKRYKVYRL